MNEELKTTLLFLKDNYITPQGKSLQREKNLREYVFCFPNGNHIQKFRTAFEKSVRKAGLHNVTPHTLRHSFASHLERVMNFRRKKFTRKGL